MSALEMYGPHALGFTLFALPAAGIAGLAYAVFGARVAMSLVGFFLSLGFGAVIRQIWRDRKAK